MFAFDGDHFKNINAVIIKSSSPDYPQQGDLWYDTTGQQFKVYLDPNWTPISPLYTAQQGKSGPEVSTVHNNLTNQDATVTKYYNAGTVVGVMVDTTVNPSVEIPGVQGSLVKGFNLGDGAKIRGTATNAEHLGNLLPSSFMRTDTDTGTSGNLTVTNDNGIAIGTLGDLVLNAYHEYDLGNVLLDSTTSIISTQPDSGLNLITTNTLGGQVNALVFLGDGTATFVSDVYLSQDLFVNGNLGVSGNVLLESNLEVGVDAQIDGNLDVIQDINAVNITLISNVTSDNLSVTTADVSDFTVFGTPVDLLDNVDISTDGVVRINTKYDPDAGSVVRIYGNVQMESDNGIDFVTGPHNSYVYGADGRIVLGTEDNDIFLIERDGSVIINSNLIVPELTSDTIYAAGNVIITDGGITTTTVDGNLDLQGDGSGFVRVNALYSDSSVETQTLDVGSISQSTSPTTGAAVIYGGLGVVKNLNVGGNVRVTGSLRWSSTIEKTEIIGDQFLSGDINVNMATGSTKYYTLPAAGNWIPNFQGSPSLRLDAMLQTGESVTAVMIASITNAAYYSNTIKVDGHAVTPRWLAFTPSAGDGDSIDVYSYSITKTGANAWLVLAGVSNFV